MYDKKFISVTSHALYPLPLSQTVTPSRTPSLLERNVLYGRPPTGDFKCNQIKSLDADRKLFEKKHFVITIRELNSVRPTYFPYELVKLA